MIQLGYHIAGSDDFITWAMHSFGSDLVLFLIFCGLLFLLHLLYSVLRFVDKLVQRGYRCLCKIAKTFETFFGTKLSAYTSYNGTIRSISNQSSTQRSTIRSSTNSRCFDRPNCPITSSQQIESISSDPSIQTISDSSSTNRTTTPSTPLSPPSIPTRRNPLRRRSSLFWLVDSLFLWFGLLTILWTS